MNIICAHGSDCRKVEKLYTTCFDDPPAFREALFARRLDDSVTLYVENGGIVASLFLLPYGLRCDGRDLCTLYLYGACTRHDMRGHGLMRGLCVAAADYTAKAGTQALLTLPQSDSLYGYYAGLGFYELPGYDEACIPRDAAFDLAHGCDYTAFTDESSLTAAACGYYRSLDCAVMQHEAALRFILDDNASEGGCAAVLQVGGLEGYVIARPWDGAIQVREALLPGDTAAAACAYLRDVYGESDLIMRFARGRLPDMLRPFSSGTKRYGMGMWVDRGGAPDAYMSMMLD